MVGEVGCAIREAAREEEREGIDKKSCDDGRNSNGSNRVLCCIVTKSCEFISNWVFRTEVWRLGRSNGIRRN